VYRAKQRGFLELDLVVGRWAQEVVPHASAQQLDETEVMLDEENPDLWKWLTGQEGAPPHLTQNFAFQVRCGDGSACAPGTAQPALRSQVLSAR